MIWWDNTSANNKILVFILYTYINDILSTISYFTYSATVLHFPHTNLLIFFYFIVSLLCNLIHRLFISILISRVSFPSPHPHSSPSPHFQFRPSTSPPPSYCSDPPRSCFFISACPLRNEAMNIYAPITFSSFLRPWGHSSVFFITLSHLFSYSFALDLRGRSPASSSAFHFLDSLASRFLS